MTDQIVITEKTSQAKDVRAAVGGRYGAILPAEGHLFDLEEPEEVLPEWKRWTPVLLRPEGLYATKPAKGGNKASKLQAIRAALKGAKCVWLATDCDREGQLIGQEILEHLKYRGRVMRVIFTAQDPQTIREAFAKARPNAEYARLYAAAVARRQADQIYNLSLTRTATVTLARGARTVIGVGRVKTPTLAIVCRRELEIRNFVPQAYFEVVATAEAAAGPFRMRHAPKERILKREVAEAIAAMAEGFEGPLSVKVEEKRQSPPRLHDLPSLQKLCGSRFGWSAARTLEVAQQLYDGEGKKVITYPRAETRYLPESAIPDASRIVAGLRAGRSFAEVPVPDPPVIRRGAGGAFHDKGLAGASHHAVIPNVNTVETLREVWPRLSIDERKLFDVIARSYLAAVMPDFRYRQTTALLDVRGHAFRATGRQPIEMGWRAAFPNWQPADEKGEDAALLPTLRDGEATRLHDAAVEDKETRPPPRYNEGTLIEAMQNAWRFVEDEALQERLKEAKGIGTPATRAEVIRGLKAQEFLAIDGKHIVPTERGLSLHAVLERADPALVDPGVTAQMERLLDEVLVGQQEMTGAIDAVCAQASRIIGRLQEGAGPVDPALIGPPRGSAPKGRGGRLPPTPAMKRFVEGLARQKGIEPPRGYATSGTVCRAFLDQHTGKAAPAEQGGAAAETGAEPAPAKRRAATERKKAAAPGQDAARPKRATRRSPGKSRQPDAAPPAPSTDESGEETPLRIPFGNKEAALRLGARYRTGGWYAPSGTDLSGFRERGWL
ncbi:type IA DNA topoisomerase [Pararoseomonas indoligenes]|uniref:type IA DNA topoisomerase n=1 Tax=Roseomonas indoligenes TaxID=2820811 RepID=UPI001FD84ED6|nr:DNA topoisomerase [Pararoseomonas indoligenes]